MYKQQTWMVYQYHDNTGLNYAFFLFAESGDQAGNLKGSKQNFQLSDVVNILVSVTGTCKVLCPLLNSVSHQSHD